MLLILFSISLCFPWVSPVRHSLTYYYTSMLNSGEFPNFVHVGVLDGLQITYYDSKSKIDIARLPWMNSSAGPDYWTQETQRLIDREKLSMANVRIATKRTGSNDKDLNFLQYTSGCEVGDDGQVSGVRQYAFNGNELISFDMERATWVAASRFARTTQDKWNKNKADNKYKQQYTKQICVKWLNTYLGYGAAALNRKDVPDVIVYHTKTLDGQNVNVHCLVTGFYPEAINVSWYTDGEALERPQSTGILPNHDGTYQTRIYFETKAGDSRSHVCHVQHSSFPGILKKPWVKGGRAGLIIGVVVVMILIAFVAAAAVIYDWTHRQLMKKKFGYLCCGGSVSSGSSTGSSGFSTGSSEIGKSVPSEHKANIEAEAGDPLMSGSTSSSNSSAENVQQPLVQHPEMGLPRDQATVEMASFWLDLLTNVSAPPLHSVRLTLGDLQSGLLTERGSRAGVHPGSGPESLRSRQGCSCCCCQRLLRVVFIFSRMEAWKVHMAGSHLIMLTFCLTTGVHAGPHTLQHLFIHRITGVPRFSMAGMLDDLQTQYYDSSLGKTEPRQQWMADSFADDYWSKQTKFAETLHLFLSSNLDPFLTLFNVKYIQGLWSCTLQNNMSTIDLVKIYSVYGEIHCQMATLHCSATGALNLIKDKFQNILDTHIDLFRALNNSCIQNMQRTLRAGKAALERKVAPEVLVFKNISSDEVPMTLLCLVTPFYPRAINATWLQNGEPVPDDLTVTVVPNHDDTYRMEILVKLEDNDPWSYTCQVHHSSLSKTLSVEAGVRGLRAIVRSGPTLGLLAVLAVMGGVP
ncbi:uncharacterized protein LOC119975565 [Scyliorhinus canicula]|uniref:uncharacterized protein LOC119975565 n=1 Tax=Scyliorhinus canicula TaxID=7830 RepID=UPI0018F4D58C|nr:uncharacterized protein LOC119975565 [Scyliorhinus canicula]